MRHIGLVLLVTLLPLTGCPQPADPGAPSGPAPDGGAQPQGAPEGAPDGSGAPAPADGATPPPPAENVPPFVVPSFSSLIVDGKSVTISGTVVGLKKAQIDFVALREENGQPVPEVLEIVKTTDGTFSVKAPAAYDRPIYVTAIEVTGEAPLATDRGGAAAAPITLAGQDVSVEITVGNDASYLEKLPWYRGGNATQPTPPPDGALPQGPPPDGAAPGGAPPAGAPPPAGEAAPGGAPPPQ